MSGKAFVDTNILIYAMDSLAGERSAQAQNLLARLWRENQGVLSTQVLQEFCVNIRRKSSRHVPLRELRATIREFMDWEVVVNTGASILRALEVQERYQISFWDAMIVQAAANAGCEVLYSEDLSHGQEYQGVLVVNPFVG